MFSMGKLEPLTGQRILNPHRPWVLGGEREVTETRSCD